MAETALKNKFSLQKYHNFTKKSDAFHGDFHIKITRNHFDNVQEYKSASDRTLINQ